ncbi:unnamed protein product [Haemonchus placei]|uniref:5-formyltetrahydrofolate cyclo-ligase n=1 Tax=Haemonchus placei TaxID=6290 RepID=A0A0N4W6M0_HAEPC|nr:unnamed protein product [Haemonchus placei]
MVSVRFQAAKRRGLERALAKRAIFEELLNLSEE